MREAIYAAYAFARIPDEIVDDPDNRDQQKAIAELDHWRESWRQAMRCGGSDDPVLNAIAYTFTKHNIPIEDGEAFLASMFQDEEKSNYKNYEELEQYMYGSAGVIGLMVTRIVGYSSEEAFPYAMKLGYAFQLTNFLRDIREDFDDLGRIYMPQDELDLYGLTRADIARHACNENFVRFMKFQIRRTRIMYSEVLPGIKMLNWQGRLAVRISFVLYREILAEIEKAEYNIYAVRARTSFSRKIVLSLKALAGTYE